ncbi:hypothetical protein SCP_0805420 [Sparassis crispa]|uniref:Uncharacterized protein n=1 Tax=Sparassis crispa TaxID=139825 RepID=A0A401GUX2_9APHY|nr:hypothetical protein SCP_0805420 [Sparassis crispa]GBE86018.1 hypothetical protein SCP_0805420 [Sparassis crispa]
MAARKGNMTASNLEASKSVLLQPRDSAHRSHPGGMGMVFSEKDIWRPDLESLRNGCEMQPKIHGKIDLSGPSRRESDASSASRYSLRHARLHSPSLGGAIAMRS